MPNANMLELVTTTLRNRRKVIADSITKNNALLAELRRRGRVILADGGRTITEPIMYGEATNFAYYSGRDALAVAGQEHLTSAEFAWKQWACGVSISGLEMMQNSGANAVIKMMKSRIEAAEKTIVNKLHASSYSDGTGSSGKELGGLDLLVSDAAGSTVGGIDSSADAWWENKRTAIAAPTTANIYSVLLQMLLDLSRGQDRPNLAIMDNTYYAVLAQALQGQQRFMNARMADAGFRNMMFEGIPIVADGGQGGYAPAGVYMLNLDSMSLTMHKDRNNVVLSGPRRPITEDSDTVILAGMGNYTINNRMLNGRIYNIA